MSARDGTPFLLVSGAGNDFIALVERPAPGSETIRAWCRRGVSVGADGLFALRRTARGRYALDYANADGGRAGLCLNAARCAARLAFEQEPDARELVIETGAGDLVAEPVDGTRTAVRVPAPAAGRRMTLQAHGRDVPGWRVDAGVPHFVLWRRGDLDEAPVAALGPVLRAHPDLGPDGANVHFVELDPPGRFRIRSWERGVEAETLACGSGVVAAAACAIADRRLALPIAAATRGGFELRLEAAPDRRDGRELWRLSGDARIVASGRMRPGAAVLLGEGLRGEGRKRTKVHHRTRPHALGLRPGFDGGRLHRLADELETEERVESEAQRRERRPAGRAPSDGRDLL